MNKTSLFTCRFIRQAYNQFINHQKIDRFISACFCLIKQLPLSLLTQKDTMIVSFGNKETKKVWNGEFSKKLPNQIQGIARRKLRMLHNSQDIDDLRIPPSNQLEKLQGNLKDYYSIRINNQWRIIFIWNESNAHEVEIIDYH